MKKTVLLAYVALLVSLVMSWASRLPECETPAVSASPRPSAAVPPTPSPQPAAAAPSPSPSPLQAQKGAPERISVKHGDEIFEQELQDYLINVLAAEMPASFHQEALKAQAVAARSYAIYCAEGRKHGDAQVCTDYGCCQAWLGDDELRERWGESYGENRRRIAQAVESTAGEYLCYDGEAIFAAFHSSSAGYTEDCAEIWSRLPYLVSVSSPETAGEVPNYVSTEELRPLDFRDTVLHLRPEADFSGPESQWVGETTRDASGRVATVTLGGAELTGAEARALFSLRSAAFTLEYTGESFLFTVTGFGHGVGMSQYGANVMAAGGAPYTQILAHYYPGAILVR